MKDECAPCRPRVHALPSRQDSAADTAGESSTFLRAGVIETVPNGEGGTTAVHPLVSTIDSAGNEPSIESSGRNGMIPGSAHPYNTTTSSYGGGDGGGGDASAAIESTTGAGGGVAALRGPMASTQRENSEITCAPSSVGSVSSLLIPSVGAAGAAANINSRGYDTMSTTHYNHRPPTLTEARRFALTLQAELAQEEKAGYGDVAGGNTPGSGRVVTRGGGGEGGWGSEGRKGKEETGECNGHPNHFFPPKSRCGGGRDGDDGGDITR